MKKYFEIDGQLEMNIEVKETKYNYWEVFFKADEEETKEDTQLEMNIEIIETRKNYFEVFFYSDRATSEEQYGNEMNKVENLINKFEKLNQKKKFQVGEVHTTYTTSWEYNPNMIEEQFRVTKRTKNKIWISGKVLEDRTNGEYSTYKNLEFTIQKDKDGNEFYNRCEFCGPYPIITYPNALD